MLHPHSFVSPGRWTHSGANMYSNFKQANADYLFLSFSRVCKSCNSNYVVSPSDTNSKQSFEVPFAVVAVFLHEKRGMVLTFISLWLWWFSTPHSSTFPWRGHSKQHCRFSSDSVDHLFNSPTSGKWDYVRDPLVPEHLVEQPFFGRLEGCDSVSVVNSGHLKLQQHGNRT